jgi:hypothetical protein
MAIRIRIQLIDQGHNKSGKALGLFYDSSQYNENLFTNLHIFGIQLCFPAAAAMNCKSTDRFKRVLILTPGMEEEGCDQSW